MPMNEVLKETIMGLEGLKWLPTVLCVRTPVVCLPWHSSRGNYGTFTLVFNSFK